MQIDQDKKIIHCFQCSKDYDIYKDIWLNILYEGSLTCPEDHLCGNQEDKEWLWFVANCSHFYLYHNEPTCKCVDEKCYCNGNDEYCHNELAKKCYKEERE